MSLILRCKPLSNPATDVNTGNVEISAMLLKCCLCTARTLWGQFKDATGRSGKSGGGEMEKVEWKKIGMPGGTIWEEAEA